MKLNLYSALISLLLLCQIDIVSAKDKAKAEESAETTVEMYSCSVELQYQWSPFSKENPETKSTADRELKLDPATAIRRIASSEVLAREALEIAQISVEQKLLENCQKTHQDKSRCIATRLRHIGSVATIASFKTREIMEESINQDCTMMQGECMGLKPTKAECSKIEQEKPVEVKEEEKNKK